MPKVVGTKQKLQHQPLESQIADHLYGTVRVHPHRKPNSQRTQRRNDEDNIQERDQRLSKRAAQILLEEARIQREELDAELTRQAKELVGDNADDGDEEGTEFKQDAKARKQAADALARLHAQAVKATSKYSTTGAGDLGDEEEEFNPAMFEDDDSDEIEEGDDYDVEDEITNADKDLLEHFLPTSQVAKINLASNLFASIAQHEERLAAGGDEVARAIAQHAAAVVSPDEIPGLQHDDKRSFKVPARSTLHPQVIKAYRDLGNYMQKYTQGKVPKLLKIIPRLKNWEEVLYYAEVDKWSPSGIRVATRFFASNLSPLLAQRFYNLILMPRVQDDIREHGKLNFHLYEALKLSIFKPVAFYKGIILPIAEEGCTLREAVIISSILSKCAIPAAYSSVALLMLSQMRFTGPGVMFMKTLLNKKYALPREVLGAVVKYFLRLSESENDMPLLWHTTLLTFVQRYKYELDHDQREKLKVVLRRKPHGAITEEIRRELFSQAPAADLTRPVAMRA